MTQTTSSSNTMSLPLFNNPSSAAERIKNHLAYKLGLAMIAYDTDKNAQGGGGSLNSF